jgi:pimeloyl-ACP methyl ester carboxylesterase
MAAFRESHPHHTTVIAGGAWTYIASGAGAEAIVILPGAHGFAEAAFHYITALERQYRVIVPNYPAEIVTLADLADGVASLMEHEGVQQAHVLGGSFGSLVAQALLQRHSERVLSVMLEHALFPRRRTGVLILPLIIMARTLPTHVLRVLLMLAVAPFQWQIARASVLAGVFQSRDCVLHAARHPRAPLRPQGFSRARAGVAGETQGLVWSRAGRRV